MRWRVAAVAFVLGACSTGLTWLALQPGLVRLLLVVQRLAPAGSPELQAAERVRAGLPVWLALSFVGTTVVAYALLQLTVGRPLRETEALVERLGQESDTLAPRPTGPLLSQVHAALARTGRALAEERARTRAQLEALREANARLAHTRTELVASERLATVGRLAAGVAHEVGNPLSGILGYLSLARERATDPVVRDFLARIDAEVLRIDGIVRGLLDLGRPSATPSALVEVRRVVEACVRLVRAAPEAAQVEVELDVPAELVVRFDSGALSQILLNLLRNAAQAQGGRGWVRVAGERVEGRARLVVEDAGPGLAPDVSAQLFEPFFTTKEAGQGTGLGLAVSRHLAEAGGGHLWAGNREGGGARFVLELPTPDGGATAGARAGR